MLDELTKEIIYIGRAAAGRWHLQRWAGPRVGDHRPTMDAIEDFNFKKDGYRIDQKAETRWSRNSSITCMGLEAVSLLPMWLYVSPKMITLSFEGKRPKEQKSEVCL
jgi:hypothetical protein